VCVCVCGGGGGGLTEEKTVPAGGRTQMAYVLGHTMPPLKSRNNMTAQVMSQLLVSLTGWHKRELR
jgi:hypothetical protein